LSDGDAWEFDATVAMAAARQLFLTTTVSIKTKVSAVEESNEKALARKGTALCVEFGTGAADAGHSSPRISTDASGLKTYVVDHKETRAFVFAAAAGGDPPSCRGVWIDARFDNDRSVEDLIKDTEGSTGRFRGVKSSLRLPEVKDGRHYLLVRHESSVAGEPADAAVCLCAVVFECDVVKSSWADDGTVLYIYIHICI